MSLIVKNQGRVKNTMGERGQTLVLLLIYVIIAITIASAAVTISLVSSKSTDKVYQGVTALDVAESGAETAMLKLLRNPSYTGEALTVNGGTATITINGTTVTSIGTLGNFTKTISATVDTSNNILTVTSWRQL